MIAIEESIILYVIFAVLIVLALIFVLVIQLSIKNQKLRAKGFGGTSVIQRIDAGDRVSLSELNDFILDKSASRSDLVKVTNYFADNIKFPSKNPSDPVPVSAKAEMYFISMVSSHPKADAGLISSFNAKLKRANPSYEKAIDQFESNGISNRRGV